MGLCGLWHGAAWTFVVWGLAHGVVMAIERIGRERLADWTLPLAIRLAITSILLSLTWVVFASPDLTSAFALIGEAGDIGDAPDLQLALVALAAVVFGTVFFRLDVYGRIHAAIARSDILAYVAYTVMLLLIIFQIWRGAGVVDFVYFRF